MYGGFVSVLCQAIIAVIHLLWLLHSAGGKGTAGKVCDRHSQGGNSKSKAGTSVCHRSGSSSCGRPFKTQGVQGREEWYQAPKF
jgi:hypothetical protein